MATALIFIIPLLQLFGYMLFSNNELKKGPKVMIISILIFYLLIFPLLMKMGRVQDGKEHCVPFPFMDHMLAIFLGVIPSLAMHLIYRIRARRKNNS